MQNGRQTVWLNAEWPKIIYNSLQQLSVLTISFHLPGPCFNRALRAFILPHPVIFILSCTSGLTREPENVSYM
jgi:hypothetical protein